MLDCHSSVFSLWIPPMCFHAFVSAPAHAVLGIAWIRYDEARSSCVTPATVDQCTPSIRCDQFEVGFHPGPLDSWLGADWTV